MASQDKIRNIAIIAHVDHGKTSWNGQQVMPFGRTRSP